MKAEPIVAWIQTRRLKPNKVLKKCNEGREEVGKKRRNGEFVTFGVTADRGLN